jgi:putative transcriptional regulator
MTSLGKRLITSAKQARAIARGDAEPARVHVPAEVDVWAIRKRTGLSQIRFAVRFGIPPATVRDWEQGRRKPEGPARVLLMVIDKEPKAVDRALKKEPA